MPLRHSPKQQSDTPTNELVSTLVQQTYDSDTPSERSGRSTANVRSKRKREQDDDVKQLRVEMRELFSKLTTSVEQQFQSIKQQNTELQESLQFISDKYDDMLLKLQQFETEKREDQIKIQILEDKVEMCERKMRSTGLEFRNLAKNSVHDKKQESKQEMCVLVKSLAKTVGVNLLDEHIKDVYRNYTNKELIKPLIVEFNSVLTKENIQQAVKTFNNDKPKGEKLNTYHLGLHTTGSPKAVYVSETLTFKAQKLFFSARQFAKENGYAFCWTSKGIIYLRKNVGQPQIRVNTEAELLKINKK